MNVVLENVLENLDRYYVTEYQPQKNMFNDFYSVFMFKELGRWTVKHTQTIRWQIVGLALNGLKYFRPILLF